MKAILLLSALALLTACTGNLEVAGGGPAIHDQHNSRGYIVTPDDTLPPADTSGLELDSL